METITDHELDLLFEQSAQQYKAVEPVKRVATEQQAIEQIEYRYQHSNFQVVFQKFQHTIVRLYAGNAGAAANRLHGYPRCYHPCSGGATLALFFAGGVTFLHSAYHTNRRADR